MVGFGERRCRRSPTPSGSEFQRLLDEIITADVFTAARTLRGINSFTRDDGTPLNYTLVNIKDWCKNSFEVVSRRPASDPKAMPWAIARLRSTTGDGATTRSRS